MSKTYRAQVKLAKADLAKNYRSEWFDTLVGAIAWTDAFPNAYEATVWEGTKCVYELPSIKASQDKRAAQERQDEHETKYRAKVARMTGDRRGFVGD